MLCDSPYCTAKQILNSCSEALNRYKWRYDQVLLIIASFLKKHLKANCSIYADLENWRATENPPGTIPPSVFATRSAPDIVIVDQSKPHQKVFAMIELTVPWNSADDIASADRRKAEKDNYCQLVANLKGLGADAKLLPIEVGSLGHFDRNAREVIRRWSTASVQQTTSMLDNASSKAISCSQTIFFARHSRIWSRPI